MTKLKLGRFSPPSNLNGAVSDADWSRVQELFAAHRRGTPLASEARAELETIRGHYLVWQYAEKKGANQDALKQEIALVEDAAKGLRFLSRYGGAADDVSASVAQPLTQEYRSLPVHMNPRKLLAVSDENAYTRALSDEYLEPIAVLLDAELLRAVSQSVDGAISRLRGRLATSPSIRSGDALLFLDSQLKAWAKKHELPHGVSKNSNEGSASGAKWPYPALVLLIDQLSPQDVRSLKSSEVASVSARILEVRKRRRAKPTDGE
ncbi:hypothetical protein [Rhizobium sp. CC-YZS058]|uniref:hypothetical protein n=1 Tax=Rhizobium sp. CC-YZS058 TaxID=3042153 RepID=UPI002B0533F2|nr:hypothetical protein [Rhizobium sp. CC-YZS058]MEA3533220.1 hypothetical protein [Rhizobium sp. CC-YZS058]